MRQNEDRCLHCDVCYGCGNKTEYEHIYCDECGSDIEEEEVREWDGLELCEECYKAKFIQEFRDKFDIPTALNIGEEDTVKVELNGFLAWYYTADQIEALLIKELEKEFAPDDLIEFLGDDYECILPTPEEVIKKLKGDTK